MSGPNKIDQASARSVGPSAREIFEQDGDNPPAFITDDSYTSLGTETLAPERYTSRAFHDLEMKHMWTRVWQMACREEEIPKSGDYIVYDIGDISVIVVRDADNQINAFLNACRHRGTQLRETGTRGNVGRFRCPFHGWTWNTDGSLSSIPCRWDFPEVTDEGYKLSSVQVGTWGGFVFINLDPDAESLESYLDMLPSHFKRWPLEDRFLTANVQRQLNCNWKVALEAFLEAYHVIQTHPQALPFTGDSNTKYDVWGDNVSRLLTWSGIPSPHMESPPSDEDITSMLIFGVGTEARAEGMELPKAPSARHALAELLKAQMKDAFGADLSHLTVTELVDSTQYFLFPNFCPWLTPALPLVYRFRPFGNDPDKCLMEAQLLHPVPDDGPRPDPVPRRELGPDVPFTDAPELNQISPVFEQDMGNLHRIQKGLKTAKEGVTLGDYQEIRIRHFHQTLDKYLAAGQRA